MVSVSPGTYVYILHQQYIYARGHPAGRSPAEEDLGVPLDTKLNLSQQCALATKKSNGILGCIRQNITSRSREVIFLHCSGLVRLHLEFCGQFCAPQYKRELSIMQRVQQAATEMLKGLVCLCYERLRAGTVHPGKEGQWGTLSMSVNADIVSSMFSCI